MRFEIRLQGSDTLVGFAPDITAANRLILQALREGTGIPYQIDHAPGSDPLPPEPERRPRTME